MKAIELLKEVLRVGNTETKGIAISGLFETQAEFVERWFGECEVNGGYKTNAKYLYSFDEELKEFADMVLNQEGRKIYLYEIEL